MLHSGTSLVQDDTLSLSGGMGSAGHNLNVCTVLGSGRLQRRCWSAERLGAVGCDNPMGGCLLRESVCAFLL
jgi:hypothetical protein